MRSTEAKWHDVVELRSFVVIGSAKSSRCLHATYLALPPISNEYLYRINVLDHGATQDGALFLAAAPTSILPTALDGAIDAPLVSVCRRELHVTFSAGSTGTINIVVCCTVFHCLLPTDSQDTFL